MHSPVDLLLAILDALSILPGKRSDRPKTQIERAGSIMSFFMWGLLAAILIFAGAAALLDRP